MKRYSFAVAAVLFTFLSGAPTFATETTGTVQEVRVREGENGARVAFMLTGTQTSCQAWGFYAFENAETGTGRLWTALLFAAYEQGRTVTVIGSGTCVSYANPDGSASPAIEGVKMIELNEVP